jgi:triosephosphate isomerase
MALFVANWKMNMSRGEARSYCEQLARRVGEGISGATLVLAPPFTALQEARDRQERWTLAAQDLSDETRGAFTGEVSAAMIRDAGCRYVLIGHSERRRRFREDEVLLARKLARAREAGLTPIFCVGETAAERQAGLTATTLVRQVGALTQDPPDAALVLAYEPVWAIGTGVAATGEDAAAARVHLSELLSERSRLTILYGGSVSAENAGRLLADSGVGGFLIGGASLDPATFEAIARARS